jgi:hypothetical protein
MTTQPPSKAPRFKQDLNPDLNPDLHRKDEEAKGRSDAPRSGDSLELQNERKEVPVPFGLGSDVNYLTKGSAPQSYEPLHPVATTRSGATTEPTKHPPVQEGPEFVKVGQEARPKAEVDNPADKPGQKPGTSPTPTESKPAPPRPGATKPSVSPNPPKK